MWCYTIISQSSIQKQQQNTHTPKKKKRGGIAVFMVTTKLEWGFKFSRRVCPIFRQHHLNCLTICSQTLYGWYIIRECHAKNKQNKKRIASFKVEATTRVQLLNINGFLIISWISQCFCNQNLCGDTLIFLITSQSSTLKVWTVSISGEVKMKGQILRLFHIP